MIKKRHSYLTKIEFWRRVVVHIVVILISLTTVMPFLYMLATSFQPSQFAYSTVPTFIPRHFTIQPYIEALTKRPFGRFYFNSLFVAGVRLFGVIFISSLAGYGFSKYKFRGRNIIFICLLTTMMIPFQLIIIPLYLMMSWFSWIDTYMALTIPGMWSAFGIFLMRQYLETVPNELIDAARIDGCSEWKIYLDIVLPLTKPALVTLAIITFLNAWNEFLWPLIVINSQLMKTVQLGILSYFGIEGIVLHLNRVMAATSICTIPILILFVLLQGYYVKGIALSGLKY